VAAVLGGVLLTGGYGGVVGICLGAVIYGIVDVGVFYTGWDPDYSQAVVGGLLFVAALGNEVLRRRKVSGTRVRGRR